jgi:hypothetical protein
LLTYRCDNIEIVEEWREIRQRNIHGHSSLTVKAIQTVNKLDTEDM